MRLLLLLLTVPLLGTSDAQRTDTIRYRSNAFGTERTIVVRTPTYHRYAGDEVQLPVILLLDGQHEWFVDPLRNDIHFLQNTHEVPQCIVVSIPLLDRVAECAPDSMALPDLPLLHLLTEEVPALLAPYHPSDITVLVGHSFSASFALYAMVHAPRTFSAVIALSPLDRIQWTIPRAMQVLAADRDKRLLLAVGGAERLKDGGHHGPFTAALQGPESEGGHPGLFVREYPSAGHTSLPIIAFPELLSTLFDPFALRDSLAPVDPEYRLLAAPPAPAELLDQVAASCTFLQGSIPWEVAEINGLASRLSYSGHDAHALAIYRRGAQLYPKLWEFQASIGELLLATDRTGARAAFGEALRLLDTMEQDMPDREALRLEIEALMQ